MEIVKCNKCGCVVTADKGEVSEGYAFYCKNCDEDLYSIETTKVERKTLVRVSMVLSRVVEVDEADALTACRKVKELVENGEVVISEANGDLDDRNYEFYEFNDTAK